MENPHQMIQSSKEAFLASLIKHGYQHFKSLMLDGHAFTGDVFQFDQLVKYRKLILLLKKLNIDYQEVEKVFFQKYDEISQIEDPTNITLCRVKMELVLHYLQIDIDKACNIASTIPNILGEADIFRMQAWDRIIIFLTLQEDFNKVIEVINLVRELEHGGKYLHLYSHLAAAYNVIDKNKLQQLIAELELLTQTLENEELDVCIGVIEEMEADLNKEITQFDIERLIYERESYKTEIIDNPINLQPEIESSTSPDEIVEFLYKLTRYFEELNPTTMYSEFKEKIFSLIDTLRDNEEKDIDDFLSKDPQAYSYEVQRRFENALGFSVRIFAHFMDKASMEKLIEKYMSASNFVNIFCILTQTGEDITSSFPSKTPFSQD